MKIVFVTCVTNFEAIEETRRSIESIQRPSGVDCRFVIWYEGSDGESRVGSKAATGEASGRNEDVVCVVHSNHEPLLKVAFLLNNLPSFNNQAECVVVIVSSGMSTFKSNLLEVLVSKMEEHDVVEDGNIVTSAGFKLFPHKKCGNQPMSLAEGIHWKSYDAACTDRAVHIFTTELCVIPLQVLVNVRDLQDKEPLHRNWDQTCVWLSYLMSTKLSPPVNIWKVKLSDCLSIRKSINSKVASDDFHKLCNELYDLGWPQGISNCVKLRQMPTISADASMIWKDGFGGVNMQIHPASELDFEAAAAYGVRVIRIGAVADARDLTYLLDPNSKSADQDKLHLLKVLPKLKAALCKAGSVGLRVIITMVDLPGCCFHSGTSESFWKSSECRERIVQFWDVLAKNLIDVRNIVVGYDIINEPYTIEDTDCDYYDDMPFVHTDILMEFYANVHQAIRKVDPTVAIILKGQWFASPRAFQSLEPINDKNVYYGFHAYIPPLLALPRLLLDMKMSSKKPSYPGYVRKWVNTEHDKVLITYDTLKQLLTDTVYAWQLKHNIPSRQILVAEFGISREVVGAELYLSDLVKIFDEFQWNWLLFSFRDEEWDALDYELGTDIRNMLHRHPTTLFQSVASHFH